MSSPTVTGFLLELDKLKLVQRRSYIGGGTRLENSAEHSWHLAMAAWSIANGLGLKVSIERLLKLALIHDVGEIDGGDTFLYAAERHAAAAQERACVGRVAALCGDLLPDLQDLWEEQERGETAEARLIKVIDRFLPLLHNLASEGKTWRAQKVRQSQVLAAHGFIADDFPELFVWIEDRVAMATQRGWLIDA
ncbi:MAG: HD domain-containing protein [Rhodoferax sp.]|nr:HD domain-containing protein [Rhodoferax sp.]